MKAVDTAIIEALDEAIAEAMDADDTDRANYAFHEDNPVDWSGLHRLQAMDPDGFRKYCEEVVLHHEFGRVP